MGTGEYTTGYTPPKSAEDVSDKGAGVVALVMMDLRAKGKTGRLAMVGVNGKKFPAIRAHMQRNIGDVYSGLDLACDTFPADDAVDPKAYIAAMDTFKPGDVCIIFTPDEYVCTVTTRKQIRLCFACAQHPLRDSICCDKQRYARNGNETSC